jgi:hypothetical protein
MYLRRRGEEHMTSSCRNQPGGLGKHAGRNITRTMQPRNRLPRRVLLVEAGFVVGDSLIIRGSLESPCEYNGKAWRTTGVGIGEISGPLESRASYDFSPTSEKW